MIIDAEVTYNYSIQPGLRLLATKNYILRDNKLFSVPNDYGWKQTSSIPFPSSIVIKINLQPTNMRIEKICYLNIQFNNGNTSYSFEDNEPIKFEASGEEKVIEYWLDYLNENNKYKIYRETLPSTTATGDLDSNYFNINFDQYLRKNLSFTIQIIKAIQNNDGTLSKGEIIASRTFYPEIKNYQIYRFLEKLNSDNQDNVKYLIPIIQKYKQEEGTKIGSWGPILECNKIRICTKNSKGELLWQTIY